ncbi:MAG: hypothetical protein H0V42_09450 [Nocardioidaceae bacterium]|nr:hypothetical protein [Nocardioidaceae bacterium]
MAKYDALRDHLAKTTDQEEVTMSFSEIESLVHGLPDSARTHGSFWSNDSKVQAKAWREAGWHVESTDLDAHRVLFARGEVGTSQTRKANGVREVKPLGLRERMEIMPNLCPNCHTAVPSTGVCDYCG